MLFFMQEATLKKLATLSTDPKNIQIIVTTGITADLINKIKKTINNGNQRKHSNNIRKFIDLTKAARNHRKRKYRLSPHKFDS